MKILITGGAGFIGSHLAEHHLDKQDDVFVVDDLSAGSLENIKSFLGNPKFTFEKADILDWKNLQEKVNWADRIYHMAAIVGVFHVLAEPVKMMHINITACDNVLNAVAKSNSEKEVLIASSSSVYGHSEKIMMSETDDLILESTTHPLRAYAISKIADEAIAIAYYNKHSFPLIIARFFNVVGPRQTGRYGMVVPRFVEQACENKPITVFGDGEQTRSFCDVRDAVNAMELLISTKKAYGEIINIGNDHEMTINSLGQLIQHQANSHSEITHIPFQEAYGVEFEEIKQRRPNLSKLRTLTNFKHQWTIETTIADLIRTFKSRT